MSKTVPHNWKIPNWLWMALFIFIVVDTMRTASEFYTIPLMGDLVQVVAPSRNYDKVLEDPLGVSVMMEGSRYPATNRYYSHLLGYVHYRTMPFAIQQFTSPIESLYWSAAIFKLITYLGLLLVLAAFINGKFLWRKELIITAAILIPFLQNESSLRSIRMISSSIAYEYFYGFPMLVLLLCLFPLYRYWKSRGERQFSISGKVILFGVAFCMSFSSVLVHPIFFLGSMVLFAGIFISFFISGKEKRNHLLEKIYAIHWSTWLMYVLVSMAMLYSMYLGRFNTENGVPPDLSFRYAALWKGAKVYFLTNPAVPLMLAWILISIYLNKRNGSLIWNGRFYTLLIYLAAFFLIYILLLPFGGYREYRPMILRSDTCLPLTFILLFTLGVLTQHNFKTLLGRTKKIYLGLFLALAFFFTGMDWAKKGDQHDCEKMVLQKIADSDKKEVLLEETCKVLSWEPLPGMSDIDATAKLLYHWNVTDELKTFRYQPN